MGIIPSLVREARPTKTSYDPQRDIPDLTEKVIIVTGGNTGIGYEIVKHLLLKNAKVYIATRDPTKSDAAIQRLKAETGKTAHFLALDLADLQSIRSSTEEFKRQETVLHVLFNNAGVSEPPLEQLTAQGYDLQFGVNVLGHYYFTRLLLPLLMSSAKHSGDGKTRIVNVASSSHLFTNKIQWDTLEDGPSRRKNWPIELYNQSKFGNVVLSNEFARRYGDQGIVSTAVNPGIIRSELQRNYGAWKFWTLDKFLLWDTPYGALTPLYAGTAPEGIDFNGKYLIPWARIGSPRKEALHHETGEKLWTWLEEQTKRH